MLARYIGAEPRPTLISPRNPDARLVRIQPTEPSPSLPTLPEPPANQDNAPLVRISRPSHVPS
jgi:hypothetical protein